MADPPMLARRMETPIPPLPPVDQVELFEDGFDLLSSPLRPMTPDRPPVPRDTPFSGREPRLGWEPKASTASSSEPQTAQGRASLGTGIFSPQTDEFLGLQGKTYGESLTALIASNRAAMQHDTMKAIAKNLG